MKKSKILLATLCFALVLAVGGCFTLTHFNTRGNVKITRTITTQIDHQSLLETFDDYNLQTTEKSVSLEANKRVSLDWTELDNLSIDAESENTTNGRYNYEFDLENNFIYMTITFTEFEEVVSIETFKGAAFYDENGNLDAVFNVEGEAVLMSEMANMDTLDQCGLFSKLIKAVKAVAGVGAVAVAGVGATVGTVGVIAIPGIAVAAAVVAAVAVGIYLIADAIVVTAQLLVDFARELNRQSEAMHMPAFLHPVTEQLMIIPAPVKRSDAVGPIRTGQNFWTVTSVWARDLAVAASGGAEGWENHGVAKGYYNHYHLLGRPLLSGHSFFGGPGGIAI